MFDESVMTLMTCRAIDIDMAGGDESKTKFGPPTFYGRFKKLEAALEYQNEYYDMKVGNAII